MERIEYLRLILKGLEEHSDSLEGYFFRECKKAEILFIENEEFFLGLTKAIESLYQDIDDRYCKQLNDIEIIKSIRIREGKPIEDLENQLSKREQQYAFLSKVTNNIILGNLHFSHIKKLEQAIIKTQMKFLSIQIEAIEKKKKAIKKETSINTSPKLKVPQIALIMAYGNVNVNKENCNELIKPYGYDSGDHLYNTFRNYMTPQKRIALPKSYTQTTLKNKIALIESVLEHLAETQRQRANNEIEALQAYVLD